MADTDVTEVAEKAPFDKKRIISIITSVVMYVFIAICVFAVFVVIFSRRGDDGAVDLFGHQMRLVISNSMEKCDQTDVSGYEIKDIPLNSMVLIELVPEDPRDAKAWYDSLEEGDVLTFKYLYSRQMTITHRLDKKEPKDGGYILHLIGDNKNSDQKLLEQKIDTTDDRSTAIDYVIGKVVAVNYPLGIFITLLKQPIGMLLTVILPCVIIIVLEVMRILGVVNEDKQKKIDEQKRQQDDRIADLERMIAELQRAKGTEPPTPSADAVEPPTQDVAASEPNGQAGEKNASPRSLESAQPKENESLNESDDGLAHSEN